MLCNTILGSVTDAAYRDKKIDYITIEWHEAFKKLHRKTSGQGREIGIRLGDEVFKRGLRDGDVLGIDKETLLVVNIPPCEVIFVTIEEHHPQMAAKVCYEIGNRHAPLFWGTNEGSYITPYNEPMLQMLAKLHGVHTERKVQKLNFANSISATIHNHTH